MMKVVDAKVAIREGRTEDAIEVLNELLALLDV